MYVCVYILWGEGEKHQQIKRKINASTHQQEIKKNQIFKRKKIHQHIKRQHDATQVQGGEDA